MRKLIFFVVALFLLASGGGLTALLSEINSPDAIPGAVVQTSDPEASVFMSTEWQARQFFLLTGFILFNVIGIGVTLAIIMWFLNRQVASVSSGSKDDKGSGSAVERAGS